MSHVKLAACIKGCLACDEILSDAGHISEREMLRTDHAVLLRWSGNLSITDGPFAETKEHLGGILVLDAEE